MSSLAVLPDTTQPVAAAIGRSEPLTPTGEVSFGAERMPSHEPVAPAVLTSVASSTLARLGYIRPEPDVVISHDEQSRYVVDITLPAHTVDDLLYGGTQIAQAIRAGMPRLVDPYVVRVTFR
jgi:hypothetical protein